MKRFLIIDDEPAIARLVKRAAEDCGYTATVTTHAEQFMDEVIEREPAAIALDLSMPDTDGVELLRFLAATKSKADIIIISGFDARVLETTARLGKALGLRVAARVTKPVRMVELRKTIAALAQKAAA